METEMSIKERIAVWHDTYHLCVLAYYLGNLSCEELCELEGLYIIEVSKLRLQLNQINNKELA